MEASYRPTLAIVLYSASSSKLNRTATTNFEVFRITEGRLHSPRRLRGEDLEDLSKAIGSVQKKQKGFSGLIPSNVLFMSEYRIMILLPAAINRIHFGAYRENPSIKLIWTPTMLLDYQGPRHHLKAYWCSEGREGIEKGRKVLLPAPMPNTNAEGSVCLGDSMQGLHFRSDVVWMADRVVERFFSSAFSEVRSGMVAAIMHRCEEIAMDPLVEAGGAKDIEQAFWKHPDEHLKKHIKQSPWKTIEQIM